MLAQGWCRSWGKRPLTAAAPFLYLFDFFARRYKAGVSVCPRMCVPTRSPRVSWGSGAFGELTLCVVAVPIRMSASDLCSFLASFNEAITDMRILRDSRSSAGSFMLLLKFRRAEDAAAFFKQFDGKPFTSFDSQVRAHGRRDRGREKQTSASQHSAWLDCTHPCR